MVTLAVTAEVGRGGVEEMLRIGVALFMWIEMKAKFLAMWKRGHCAISLDNENKQ